jgi:hypothetical protein
MGRKVGDCNDENAKKGDVRAKNTTNREKNSKSPKQI